MYSLYGIEENIRNVYCLSKKYISDTEIDTVTLREGYTKFLDDFQPKIPHVHGTSKTFFVDSKELEEKMVLSYANDSFLNDRNQKDIVGEPLSLSDREAAVKKVLHGLDTLREKDQKIYDLFNMVINSIFFRSSKRAVGGSSSASMGAIWMNHSPKLENGDIVELLVHELAHHMMFIDERCYLHYYYEEIIKEENYAISAVLNIRRPLDKVVHSIVVGAELLLARETFLNTPGWEVKIHPNTQKLREQLRGSLESVFSLKNIKSLVTDRCLDILKKCQEVATLNHKLAA